MENKWYIVLWAPKGSNRLFEADVHAVSPQAAREAFRKLFPLDDVWGVKMPYGNGRFV